MLYECSRYTKMGIKHCFIIVWSLTISTISASYYEEEIAPAAQNLDRDLPKGIMGSHLKYPELLMQPSIEGDENFIHFTKFRPSTYTKYVDQIQKLFDDNNTGADDNESVKEYNFSEYTGPEWVNRIASYTFDTLPLTEFGEMIDCRSYRTYRVPYKWDQSCRFDLNLELGGTDCYDRKQGFGYAEGSPCVFLTLGRVYNWVPEPYSSNDTVPNVIQGSWDPDYITVKCEGTGPDSVDNLIRTGIHPRAGFNFKFFPDNGLYHWRSPIVAVQIDTRAGVPVEIKCTTWAKNMIHRDLLNTGSVTFTMLVD